MVLIGWASACEIRTERQGYLNYAPDSEILFIMEGHWGFVYVKSAQSPPCVMHLLFYKYYVVEDGDDVTKKDLEKPLWKNDQNFMTVCWFLRMSLDDLM